MSSKERKWVLFEILPHQDCKVAHILEVAHIESFIPFHTVTRKWGNEEKQIMAPAFGGIGFALVDNFDLHMLQMIHEISLVKVADEEYKTVSHQQMESIRKDKKALTELWKGINGNN